MSISLGKDPQKSWKNLQQWVLDRRRVWLVASSVAGIVIGIRFTGLLQSMEWAAFDQLVQLRPSVPPDPRILIVGIDEQDVQQNSWPIPDQVMAELLEKLNASQPRVIGLDVYRDLPVGPGSDQLEQTFRRLPNLIGIEKIGDKLEFGVRPPRALDPQKQVGFNNVVIDADGKIRRSLLFWHVKQQPHTSFALLVAMRYLESQGIIPKAAANSNYMQLGEGVFVPFKPNDGAYVRADDRGYQILADFQRVGDQFQTVSMSEVLEGKVPPDQIRDRIVLIGSTATSLRDFFATPYSSSLFSPRRLVSGVEVQANFVSQFLDVALTGENLIQPIPDWVEWFWIFTWSAVGGLLSWQIRSQGKLGLSLIVATLALGSSCYVLFLADLWMPLVPPVLALVGSAGAIASYLTHLDEELNRSKEFLHKIIDTIPDPIFVQDTNHRWIVLNQAFCNFIGYPLEELLEKSVYDVFPKREAEIFWQQGEQIFQTRESQENEEEFTNSQGKTHQIATKRSLHQDSAGNLFLVGVIRDITERKLMEEELKRVASELARSNAELKLSEDHLRYLAYHDALTGLANRKLFEERLEQAIDWAKLNSQMVALLFLDLDGFKQINDTLGHDIGDLLLKAVAGRLTGCLRSSDTVARLGGDEFTVILPAIPSVADAIRVADKILTAITRPFTVEQHSIHVTTSVSIALYPVHADNTENLLKNADAAMYRAKELGKNQYSLIPEEVSLS